MPEERTKGGWTAWRPSKGLRFWSCVGAAALMMIVGFGWGGWVTGGPSARWPRTPPTRRARSSPRRSCVYRFSDAPDAKARLAAREMENTWLRGDFIGKGGWTTLAGMSTPVPEAAGIRAEKLLQADTTPPEKTQG